MITTDAQLKPKPPERDWPQIVDDKEARDAAEVARTQGDDKRPDWSE